jgi:hypothetical protein
MKRWSVAPGCFFEPAEDDEVVDPVMGVNKGSIAFGDSYYRRRSTLEDIPDDFEARMKNFKRSVVRTEEREVKTPDGFVISIAYNKSGYQLIPKEDL